MAPAERISRKGCSSAGRGFPKSLSQASDPNPTTQVRPASIRGILQPEPDPQGRRRTHAPPVIFALRVDANHQNRSTLSGASPAEEAGCRVRSSDLPQAAPVFGVSSVIACRSAVNCSSAALECRAHAELRGERNANRCAGAEEFSPEHPAGISSCFRLVMVVNSLQPCRSGCDLILRSGCIWDAGTSGAGSQNWQNSRPELLRLKMLKNSANGFKLPALADGGGTGDAQIVLDVRRSTKFVQAECIRSIHPDARGVVCVGDGDGAGALAGKRRSTPYRRGREPCRQTQCDGERLLRKDRNRRVRMHPAVRRPARSATGRRRLRDRRARPAGSPRSAAWRAGSLAPG